MALSAVLDACVLYPIGLRDTLLNIAEAGCFRVLWTEEILTETSRNILEDIPDLTAEHLEKTFAAMRRAFPEATVENYGHLVDSMTNHPKDRHVLAAAVAAEADVIVTLNTRHFPRAACDPHGIEVLTPDALLCDIAEAWPELVVAWPSCQLRRRERRARRCPWRKCSTASRRMCPASSGPFALAFQTATRVPHPPVGTVNYGRIGCSVCRTQSRQSRAHRKLACLTAP